MRELFGFSSLETPMNKIPRKITIEVNRQQTYDMYCTRGRTSSIKFLREDL